MAPRLGRGIM